MVATARQYVAHHLLMQKAPLVSLILSTTSQAVSVQGCAYLQDRGLQPTSHGVVYSMLVSLYQQDSIDKVGNEILCDLKVVLTGQEMSANSKGQRAKQLNKLLTEVRFS